LREEIDGMDAIRVAVVDWTGRDEADLLSGIAALQEQVHLDFAPVWRVDADLVLVPNEVNTTWPGHWGLVLFHEEDTRSARYQAGTSDGHPIAGVPIEAGDDNWTHRASRELLEMLVDPDRVGAVLNPSGQRFYAKRVCAPCAAVSEGYRRGGRLVSDFVYPAWFGSAVAGRGGRRFDQRGHIHAAFQVLVGSSIGYVDLATPPWRQLEGDVEPHADPEREGAWPP
jgi:hypothetical protein